MYQFKTPKKIQLRQEDGSILLTSVGGARQNEAFKVNVQ